MPYPRAACPFIPMEVLVKQLFWSLFVAHSSIGSGVWAETDPRNTFSLYLYLPPPLQ